MPGALVNRPSVATDLPVISVSARDAETALASALRVAEGTAIVSPTRLDPRLAVFGARRAGARLRRLARDAAQLVEARLPGGVRCLEVSAECNRVVLRGIASSYYVKQVAQQVAMSLLSGEQVVNQIEVRSVR